MVEFGQKVWVKATVHRSRHPQALRFRDEAPMYDETFRLASAYERRTKPIFEWSWSIQPTVILEPTLPPKAQPDTIVKIVRLELEYIRRAVVIGRTMRHCGYIYDGYGDGNTWTSCGGVEVLQVAFRNDLEVGALLLADCLEADVQ
jgi:hypothetical protein